MLAQDFMQNGTLSRAVHTIRHPKQNLRLSAFIRGEQ
jgi:hypothetical protein